MNQVACSAPWVPNLAPTRKTTFLHVGQVAQGLLVGHVGADDRGALTREVFGQARLGEPGDGHDPA
ncbi:hypothetical protein GCM10020219_066650 [Nonomuraea dietziae]